MKCALLIFFALLTSCKNDQSEPLKTETAKVSFKWPHAVSEEKSVQIANAYEKSIQFTPTTLTDIDALKSEKDVQHFIRQQGPNYSSFELLPISLHEATGETDSIIRIIAKNAGIRKSFYKYDIDNNGLTDLLAFDGASSPIVVMNLGKLKITIPLNIYFIEPMAVKIIPDKDIPRLKAYNIPAARWKVGVNEPIEVELVFDGDAFIEYNNSPTRMDVSKVEFSSSLCYGTCPNFQLTLNKNGPSYFIAKHYNFYKSRDDFSEAEEGFFAGEIAFNDFSELISLLNYIDFVHLKSEYFLTASDMPSSTLIITYNNGKIKKIRDYGLRGTYGLVEVYKKCFALRFNQKWEKVEEVPGIRLIGVY